MRAYVRNTNALHGESEFDACAVPLLLLCLIGQVLHDPLDYPVVLSCTQVMQDFQYQGYVTGLIRVTDAIVSVICFRPKLLGPGLLLRNFFRVFTIRTRKPSYSLHSHVMVT